MTRTHLAISGELHDYVLAHSGVDPGLAALAATLADETARRFPDAAGMQIASDEGALLHLLVRISGARRLLEVGTFTGMSSLWMARALPPGGRLLCLDVSEEWTALARRYWEAGGVADRIDLRLGPALEGLRALPSGPQLDLVFLDADKETYPDYLAEIVPRLAPGGLLLADNVLWRGTVADPSVDDAATAALRRFNREVADHPGLDGMILPVADGLTLARRRG